MGKQHWCIQHYSDSTTDTLMDQHMPPHLKIVKNNAILTRKLQHSSVFKTGLKSHFLNTNFLLSKITVKLLFLYKVNVHAKFQQSTMFQALDIALLTMSPIFSEIT